MFELKGLWEVIHSPHPLILEGEETGAQREANWPAPVTRLIGGRGQQNPDCPVFFLFDHTNLWEPLKLRGFPSSLQELIFSQNIICGWVGSTHFTPGQMAWVFHKNQTHSNLDVIPTKPQCLHCGKETFSWVSYPTSSHWLQSPFLCRGSWLSQGQAGSWQGS